jgi:hypothetical protein
MRPGGGAGFVQAGDQESVELLGEIFPACRRDPHGADEAVVGQFRRDRHRQAHRCHGEGFPDRPGYPVQPGLAGSADGNQRAVELNEGHRQGLQAEPEERRRCLRRRDARGRHGRRRHPKEQGVDRAGGGDNAFATISAMSLRPAVPAIPRRGEVPARTTLGTNSISLVSLSACAPFALFVGMAHVWSAR